MARTVLIDGDPALPVKRRNPWGVLGLTLITLGIYNVVWWYKINDEMVRVGRARRRPDLGESAGTSLVALLAGGIVIVPALWTYVTTSRRIQRTQEVLGMAKRMNGWLLAALYVVTLGLGAMVFQQYHLNRAWAQLELGPTAGTVGPSAPPSDLSAPPPPPPPPAPNPFGDNG